YEAQNITLYFSSHPDRMCYDTLLNFSSLGIIEFEVDVNISSTPLNGISSPITLTREWHGSGDHATYRLCGFDHIGHYQLSITVRGQNSSSHVVFYEEDIDLVTVYVAPPPNPPCPPLPPLSPMPPSPPPAIHLTSDLTGGAHFPSDEISLHQFQEQNVTLYMRSAPEPTAEADSWRQQSTCYDTLLNFSGLGVVDFNVEVNVTGTTLDATSNQWTLTQEVTSKDSATFRVCGFDREGGYRLSVAVHATDGTSREVFMKEDIDIVSVYLAPPPLIPFLPPPPPSPPSPFPPPYITIPVIDPVPSYFLVLVALVVIVVCGWYGTICMAHLRRIRWTVRERIFDRQFGILEHALRVNPDGLHTWSLVCNSDLNPTLHPKLPAESSHSAPKMAFRRWRSARPAKAASSEDRADDTAHGEGRVTPASSEEKSAAPGRERACTWAAYSNPPATGQEANGKDMNLPAGRFSARVEALLESGKSHSRHSWQALMGGAPSKGSSCGGEAETTGLLKVEREEVILPRADGQAAADEPAALQHMGSGVAIGGHVETSQEGSSSTGVGKCTPTSEKASSCDMAGIECTSTSEEAAGEVAEEGRRASASREAAGEVAEEGRRTSTSREAAGEVAEEGRRASASEEAASEVAEEGRRASASREAAGDASARRIKASMESSTSLAARRYTSTEDNCEENSEVLSSEWAQEGWVTASQHASDNAAAGLSNGEINATASERNVPAERSVSARKNIPGKVPGSDLADGHAVRMEEAGGYVATDGSMGRLLAPAGPVAESYSDDAELAELPSPRLLNRTVYMNLSRVARRAKSRAPASLPTPHSLPLGAISAQAVGSTLSSTQDLSPQPVPPLRSRNLLAEMPRGSVHGSSSSAREVPSCPPSSSLDAVHAADDTASDSCGSAALEILPPPRSAARPPWEDRPCEPDNEAQRFDQYQEHPEPKTIASALPTTLIPNPASPSLAPIAPRRVSRSSDTLRSPLLKRLSPLPQPFVASPPSKGRPKPASPIQRREMALAASSSILHRSMNAAAASARRLSFASVTAVPPSTQRAEDMSAAAPLVPQEGGPARGGADSGADTLAVAGQGRPWQKALWWSSAAEMPTHATSLSASSEGSIRLSDAREWRGAKEAGRGGERWLGPDRQELQPGTAYAAAVLQILDYLGEHLDGVPSDQEPLQRPIGSRPSASSRSDRVDVEDTGREGPASSLSQISLFGGGHARGNPSSQTLLAQAEGSQEQGLTAAESSGDAVQAQPLLEPVPESSSGDARASRGTSGWKALMSSGLGERVSAAGRSRAPTIEGMVEAAAAMMHLVTSRPGSEGKPQSRAGGGAGRASERRRREAEEAQRRSARDRSVEADHATTAAMAARLGLDRTSTGALPGNRTSGWTAVSREASRRRSSRNQEGGRRMEGAVGAALEMSKKRQAVRRQIGLRLRVAVGMTARWREAQERRRLEMLASVLRVPLRGLRCGVSLHAFQKRQAAGSRALSVWRTALRTEKVRKEPEIPQSRMLGTALLLAFLARHRLAGTHFLHEQLELAVAAPWAMRPDSKDFMTTLTEMEGLLDMMEGSWPSDDEDDDQSAAPVMVWSLSHLQCEDGSFAPTPALDTALQGPLPSEPGKHGAEPAPRERAAEASASLVQNERPPRSTGQCSVLAQLQVLKQEMPLTDELHDLFATICVVERCMQLPCGCWTPRRMPPSYQERRLRLFTKASSFAEERCVDAPAASSTPAIAAALRRAAVDASACGVAGKQHSELVTESRKKLGQGVGQRRIPSAVVTWVLERHPWRQLAKKDWGAVPSSAGSAATACCYSVAMLAVAALICYSNAARACKEYKQHLGCSSAALAAFGKPPFQECLYSRSCGHLYAAAGCSGHYTCPDGFSFSPLTLTLHEALKTAFALAMLPLVIRDVPLWTGFALPAQSQPLSRGQAAQRYTLNGSRRPSGSSLISVRLLLERSLRGAAEAAAAMGLRVRFWWAVGLRRRTHMAVFQELMAEEKWREQRRKASAAAGDANPSSCEGMLEGITQPYWICISTLLVASLCVLLQYGVWIHDMFGWAGERWTLMVWGFAILWDGMLSPIITFGVTFCYHQLNCGLSRSIHDKIATQKLIYRSRNQL
ncbi:hypothetical protein CYMTET_19009, partial [Cymbomonas tetramitiformis]